MILTELREVLADIDEALQNAEESELKELKAMLAGELDNVNKMLADFYPPDDPVRLRLGPRSDYDGSPSDPKPKVRKPKARMHCNECGRNFSKTIGPRTYEAKCPKCGGYDTEVA